MGWFHKAFGVSSQPAVEKMNQFYGGIHDLGNDTVGKVVHGVTGSDKATRLMTGPSWQEMGKPGEAFYNEFNESASVLPPSWRQYAPAVAATALNFVPGVGPLLSAAFTTAYKAGQMQANQKGMDWGAVGRDAAINFGTAAASMGANQLAQNASNSRQLQLQNMQGLKATGQAAPLSYAGRTDSALKAFDSSQFANSSQGMRAGYDAAQASRFAPVEQSFGNGVSGIPSTNTSSLDLNRQVAMGKNTSALSPVNVSMAGADVSGLKPSTPAPGYSATPAPKTSFSPYTRAVNATYDVALKSAPEITNAALTSTLAPEGNAPITGSFEGGSPYSDLGLAGTYQPGQALAAFGGGQNFVTPNPTGMRIQDKDMADIANRIGANAFLQNQDLRDRFTPAGLSDPSESSQYATKLNQVNKSSQKAFEDATAEVGNYNKYYGLLDTNSWLNPDALNKMIADPTQQPANMLDYFKGMYVPTTFSM